MQMLIFIGLKFIRLQEMGLIFQKKFPGEHSPGPPWHGFTPAAHAYFAPVALVLSRLRRSLKYALTKLKIYQLLLLNQLFKITNLKLLPPGLSYLILKMYLNIDF